jgi:CO/xanthine dehydrogenase Mo-binding subunit
MIGQSVVGQDARSKVTGEARFAGDYHLPGMLHMKLKFAGRPHAQIRGINIDQVRECPGVITVLTAQDVPVNRYGLILEDQPVFCDEVVRFEGDQVAAVVAESPEQASQAIELIGIEYQNLPTITSPETANAPQLHQDFPDNLAHTIRLRKGDTESALSKAFLVYENEYHTPMQEHAYLEVEAGLAYVDQQGRIVVRTAGQNPHDDQLQIAKALDLPLERVRVVYGPVGGAFGGREDISIQIVLALAAWKTGRPVGISWERRESIRGHCKRHATRIKHRWGADEDGRITAAEVEILLDAGAYMYTSSSVLECLHSTCVGPYQIKNVKLDGRAVFTNNVPGGAFRGYGTPQTAFAAELHITQMAELLGIDPITIRTKNCLQEDSLLPTGWGLPGGSSLVEIIERCAKQSGCEKTKDKWLLPDFESLPDQRSGFGLAIGMKATGYGFGYPEGSTAKIVLNGGAKIEQAELYTGAVDVGQGAHTVLVQIAAHELGLRPEQVEIIPCDTSLSLDAGAAAASRLTYFAGNAVKLAAEAAMKDWQDESRPAVGEARWVSPVTTAPDPETGACIDNVSYSFAAQAVKVDVDMETGLVRIGEVTAVQNVGKAINPKKIEGQIEGAVVQAQGWALMENFVVDKGRILTDNLRTYLIPTALDIPRRVNNIQIESPDPFGPYGVRGVGEIPFIPLAPAVITAIQDATGIWIDHIPLKPEQVVQKIQELRDKDSNAVE